MNRMRKIALGVSLLSSFLFGCDGGGGGGGGEGPKEYKVIYHGNGNTEGICPIEWGTFLEGATITVRTPDSDFKRDAYSFGGWNLQSDGGGINYEVAQTFVMPNSDVNLYANWVLLPLHSIIYDGNGNTSGAIPVDLGQYWEGQQVKILENSGNLVKTGYTFASWGNNGESYSPGQEITMPGRDITLSAVWVNPGTVYDTLGLESGASSSIKTIVPLSDGKLLVGGGFLKYGTFTRPAIVRLYASGQVDTSFDAGSFMSGDVNSIAVQADGKIIVGGLFSSIQGVSVKNVARLNQDGSLDTTFNTGAGADGEVKQVRILSNGSILIAGLFATFNGVTANRLARIKADGSLDATFSTGTVPSSAIYDIELQSDGKIIVGGTFSSFNGVASKGIIRLDVNGTVDTSFVSGSGITGQVNQICVLSDSKILVGGSFTNYNGTDVNDVARLNADGTLDTALSVGSGANAGISSMEVQEDGKILIGGSFTTVNGITRNYLARLYSDGTVDPYFNAGAGPSSRVYAIVPEGKKSIIIGGFFTAYDDRSRSKIARIFQ